MPYASRAQQRKFHAMEDRGEMGHATVREFDQASKGRKLPERSPKGKKASKGRAMKGRR